MVDCVIDQDTSILYYTLLVAGPGSWFDHDTMLVTAGAMTQPGLVIISISPLIETLTDKLSHCLSHRNKRI